MVKKDTKVTEEKASKEKKEKEVKTETPSLIIAPRLTEKASNLSSLNIYTFDVKDNANKVSLAREIEKTYKVKPLKITILNNPRKAVYRRGSLGFKSGFKKAQVTLKKGDKISLS